MFADTHCHLDFKELASQLETIQMGMYQRSLGMLVVPSVERKSWPEVIDICLKDERFFFGLGLHPYFIDRHEVEDLSVLANEIERLKKEKSNKLVAVGEIGLDFTRPSIEKQINLFEAQLALAGRYKLPVIIHTRKANAETLASLKKYNIVGGVIHAFSGSFELMMSYIDQGLKIGVGPVITWPSASKSRDAVSRAPIDSLVLETDAPDMSVTGVVRGSGSPLNVCDVFDVLANIRAETKFRLEQALWKNSAELFIRQSCS
jgi:TatD DNase family protein